MAKKIIKDTNNNFTRLAQINSVPTSYPEPKVEDILVGQYQPRMKENKIKRS